ncbi:hypothetical protein HPB52_017940 [Rhipicephalus sanguineus]|uniref:Uncharacterized protein n=1 Tax=Rhipicephalus sanguineus TaxID=34632 RepID=A0A9D4QBM2_RHISA|nr:hypothetical protein HPB52_017940 [Rhipicephalus sanguineus]
MEERLQKAALLLNRLFTLPPLQNFLQSGVAPSVPNIRILGLHLTSSLDPKYTIAGPRRTSKQVSRIIRRMFARCGGLLHRLGFNAISDHDPLTPVQELWRQKLRTFKVPSARLRPACFRQHHRALTLTPFALYGAEATWACLATRWRMPLATPFSSESLPLHVITKSRNTNGTRFSEILAYFRASRHLHPDPAHGLEKAND